MWNFYVTCFRYRREIEFRSALPVIKMREGTLSLFSPPLTDEAGKSVGGGGGRWRERNSVCFSSAS